MEYVILFLVVFIVVFFLYLITVILNKRKLSSFHKSNQALILIKKYDLKIDKDNKREFAIKIALVNSFVIAVTATIIEFVNNIFLKVLVAMVVMIPLMLIFYKLIGKSMKKEGK